ncbi:MAG: hypothetical protein KHZ58_12570 [Hungatella hathewayi]|nr:hypothetical protein [Hungatella hathewayi]
MNNTISPICRYNRNFDNYINLPSKHDYIYQSSGLKKHIMKRHSGYEQYLNFLPQIIASPDFIGINPNEKGVSFELVKVFSEHLQIGIKLDEAENYLYVATLHPITESKLQHGIKNGRLRPFDK